MVLLLSLLTNSLAQAALSCSKANEDYFSKTEPLFWRVQADFGKVNDPNIDVSDKAQAHSLGLLTYSSIEAPLKVRVQARGAFRFSECSIRPFNLELEEADHKGQFPYVKNFKKLKVTTLCSDHKAYQENEIRKLYKEYTIYRMLAHFAGPQLQVRLLNIELRQADGSLYFAGPAFIRETKSALAGRCGMKERLPKVKTWDNETKSSRLWLLNKDRSLSPYLYKLDPEAQLRMEFINRFLGNIDYNIELDHNLISLVSKDKNDLREFLIAYDFDLSQAAGSTYFGFAKKPYEVAQETMLWLANQQLAPEFAESLRQELLQALPKMTNEVLSSPLDAQGQQDLLDWLEAFSQTFG